MAFTVEVSPAARRQLRNLDRSVQRRVLRRLEALGMSPRPPGVVQLTSPAGPLYRVREGDWRIVYRVEDDKLLVLVVRIGHRSEVYR